MRGGARRPPRGSPSASLPLDERVQPIRTQTRPVFFAAVRPSDVETIDHRRCAETEVHAKVILRQITAAAANLLPLLDSGGDDVDPRADRVTIRLRAHEFELEPVLRRFSGDAVE